MLRASDPDTALRARQTVEHIGRWIGIAQRQHPSSRLGPDEVRLAVHGADGDPLGADDRAAGRGRSRRSS